jgi:cation diffusion facilitator CzcD-associated flavoprotein CzcO
MDAVSGSQAPLDVLIVGAGISGIGMAAHLTKQCPHKRFALIERRERLGGTWDLFRYPGVRSDSDMYTLGYGFEPWREDFAIAGGESILAYLDRVVDSRDLRGKIRFGQSVTSADWDSRAGLWTLTLEDAAGKVSTLSGRFLFMGTGYYDYDDPHDAAIPGIEGFGGTVIHPQFWPQEFDHAGKRVVVIGSGATAATLVPNLADKAAHVTMLQRTPTWYVNMPSRDRLAWLLKRMLPANWAHGIIRARNSLLQNIFVKRSHTRPESVKAMLHRQIESELGKDFDREAFTPPYDPWQQRMCLVPEGDLFKAIKAGTASIVTGHIETVDKTGITLTDGRHIDADVIVTATGLRLCVLGKARLSLDGEPIDFSKHFYYRNCMFSNVPNMAALFGYLTAGWTLRVDVVADWLCRLFAHMDKWGVDVVTPALPDDHGLVEEDPFGIFSSGYIQRGIHLIPKSSTTAPWRIGMDYLADRSEQRDAPIDDGVLRFERSEALVPAQ